MYPYLESVQEEDPTNSETRFVKAKETGNEKGDERAYRRLKLVAHRQVEAKGSNGNVTRGG